MNRAGQQGFTIIEVTLFLAISGLMVAGVLAFSMGNINQQRYRDTITTFQADLQQVYADTISISNTRAGGSGDACNSPQRANSSCVILGRYMTVNTDGDYASYNVMAASSTCETGSGGSDIGILQACELRLDAQTSESGAIDWGSSLGWPRTGSGGRGTDESLDRLGQPRAFSMLVLRSPESGHVYTFTADAASTSTAYINRMVREGRTSERHPGAGNDRFHGRENRTICIDPAGFNVAEPMAILISRNANNAQHVELASAGILAAAGTNTRC